MNLRVEQINWHLLGATIGGFVLATFLGVTIASNDYVTLIYVATFLGIVAYVAYFQKYTWHIALLLCYLGLFFWPTGFRFGATELTLGLGVLLAITTGWQKRPLGKIGILRHGSFTFLRSLLLLWIVYVAVHMWYNIHNPFRPSEFALKNALKTYFTELMPIALLWYFSGNPTGIRIKGNITRTLTILLLLGVTFNLAITCYGILTHHNVVDPDVETRYLPAFLIPGLNAFENPYTLRALGPAAVLFSAITLCLSRYSTGVSRRLSIFLLLVGSLGCLLSGGRSAVTTAVLLVLTMLLLRKRVLASAYIVMVAGFLVVAANLSSNWVNREAPIAIARPLQWIMLSKNKVASGSIESSTQWREELLKMAIAEWRSDPRIFWFGRATYGYGVSDYVAMQVSGGWEAAMQSSLRRGATHNLLSDLLVTYGLIGCILYYCMILATIGFLWIVYRSRSVPTTLEPLSLFCLITFASYPVIASVAGGFYSAENMWLLIVLIAALYHYDPPWKASRERVAHSTEPLPSRVTPSVN